jgi:hypothetical protein
MVYPIGGLVDDNQAKTQQPKFGVFTANLEDSDKNLVPITSVAFSVPGSRVGLFSEVQAAFAGNTIIREGDPASGRHGILTPPDKSGKRTFIPYHFSKRTLLWYIKILPSTKNQAMLARRLDPIELWDRYA